MGVSVPESTPNHFAGMPVLGSASSRRPLVFRYSPVMEEAVTRSVCWRASPSLPMPTFTMISSTLDLCRRAPCLATNWSRKPVKSPFASAADMSTFDMKCARMLLLGVDPTFGLSRARSSSSTASIRSSSGHCIQSPDMSSVCEIMRAKTVPGGFLPALALAVLLAPRKTCELRPIVGMMRSRSYSFERPSTSRSVAKVGLMSRRAAHSAQSSAARKHAERGR
mmetsp:Transcript_73194/g.158375  ORF Transcript_73194/g.158375 Transcript_73194/m.158375 type:complete len:223 (-) Transcript_73194:43-711(-)